MANFFTRVVERFAGSQIQKIIEQRVREEVGKAQGGDVVRFSPRTLAWPGGNIQKSYPLGVSFQTLRDLADFYPVARAAIEFRKSQITHLEWNIVPVDLTSKTVQDQKNIEDAKKIKEFLKYPTGKKDSSMVNWFKQILEDLLVIDAVAIYKRKNRRGDIIGYLPVDGATIELIVESDGTTPEPPDFAYVQKINGQEKTKLTTEELIYAVMTPKTSTPYGLAPLETLIITVTTALKLQAYNLSFLSEGNIPNGFITLPRDIASSRDQLKEWQDAWDAMLSGDPRFQQKLKFLPEGMKYEPSVKAEDMTFERFEKFLLQSTCSVFGIHPSAIGFNFDVNRSSAETSWEVGRERGLFPTALFLKDIMNRIVQDDLGYKDLQFIWTNIDPTNRSEEAKVVQTLVNSGLMSIDEWRLSEGLRPIGVDEPFIMGPVGPIFAKDLLAQSESGQQPVVPYKPIVEPKKTSLFNNSSFPKNQIEVYQELKKWKKAVLNDIKKKHPLREFYSEILDPQTKNLIKQELKNIKNKEDVIEIFAPFFKKEFQEVPVILHIYDKVNKAIDFQRTGFVSTVS